jgi:hypothetical protein
MDQRTHSWIAIRAIALLEEEGKAPSLVKLLKPHAREASVGAWIPDQTDAKRGGCATDNHVLKIEPYQGTQTQRFVMDKKTLLRELGPQREMGALLTKDNTLTDAWWAAAYKGDVQRPGQHLPNRAMALATTMKDLLLLGGKELDALIPGAIHFIESLTTDMRTTEDAATMYFFMLSHFIADSCMPCHCDGRKIMGYGAGFHKELEDHWAEGVGKDFEKQNLLKGTGSPDDLLKQAKKVDAKFGLQLAALTVPDLVKGHDVWLEMMQVCRASFAVASIMAPPDTFPYDHGKATLSMQEVFIGNRLNLLAEVDKAVLHDAVLNTAIIWKHVWNKVTKD